MSGKETGLRCLSRSLAAPPPGASSFSSAGHSTRRFWKVSLKAEVRRGGGNDRTGALPKQLAGIRTPREAGWTAQGAARSEAPAHQTVAPPGARSA